MAIRRKRKQRKQAQEEEAMWAYRLTWEAAYYKRVCRRVKRDGQA